ncbi:hypothetical protein RRG08_022865 [Elysia crispata]|uniref:Uncharacterized protein n=1 Tax=Elysia crispata TaxID=231223 RepID=A0AAE0Z0B5_9GAST|nr:hypothetical protein RRG08_022865 [Elysia crispata]
MHEANFDHATKVSWEFANGQTRQGFRELKLVALKNFDRNKKKIFMTSGNFGAGFCRSDLPGLILLIEKKIQTSVVLKLPAQMIYFSSDDESHILSGER